MKRLTVLLFVTVASAVAALAGAAPAHAAFKFDCTAPSGLPPAAFTCSHGGQDFDCTSATPAPGAFTCTGKGNRSFVCTRTGLNSATCVLQPSGKEYDCTFDGDLTGAGSWTCKKP